ncbi:hypothetical protein [Micromonospora andamanensis]|uniref:hypothetical protein n=1 Tax=Micromonospora andamanensis TaxID=1287068 RepID=UPI00194E85A0|nr:hypothetical protein [Micromonospora andamanensis]GIJ36980.1 hypothetical protein Vwe01_03050 [Micromonospora andamanensis]
MPARAADSGRGGIHQRGAEPGCHGRHGDEYGHPGQGVQRLGGQQAAAADLLCVQRRQPAVRLGGHELGEADHGEEPHRHGEQDEKGRGVAADATQLGEAGLRGQVGEARIVRQEAGHRRRQQTDEQEVRADSGGPAGQRAQHSAYREALDRAEQPQSGRATGRCGDQPGPHVTSAGQGQPRRTGQERRTGEYEQRQQPVLVVRADEGEQAVRRQPAQPAERGDAVADHPGQQPDAEYGQGQPARPGTGRHHLCAQQRCRHGEERDERETYGVPQRPGRWRARRDEHDTCRRSGGRHRGSQDGEVPAEHGRHRQPASQQQVPPAALLLTPGDPGGGEHPPHREQDGQDGAGPPDGETASGVQRERFTEEGADRRVLGEGGQCGSVERGAGGALVPGDHHGCGAGRQRGHDERAPAYLAQGEAGDGGPCGATVDRSDGGHLPLSP